MKLAMGSGGRSNLDDLMRLLWQVHGRTGLGVNDSDIQQLANQLVDETLDDFFERVLNTTQELDLAAFFDQQQIKYQCVSQEKPLEHGGFVESPRVRTQQPSLSISHRANPLGAEVVVVFSQGSASIAGISNKDVIIAIDDYHVDSSDIDQQIARYQVGDKINISLFRRDKLCHFEVTLTASSRSVCFLSFKQDKPSKLFHNWIANSKARMNKSH
ncbi:MAG: PDZ domain-containing protein [Enterobacterales bacterium]|nr:PDZ domain-containing protein [Enterobacterales bacterium]